MIAATKIVRDGAGQYFRVVDCKEPELAHCWSGYPVKRVKGEFVLKAKPTARLIRKYGCAIIEG